MAKQIDIEWNNQGFRDILTSDDAYDACIKAGEKIASAAGDGFGVRVGTNSKVRAHVWVVAETHEARVAQAEDEVLSKAVG